MRTALIQMSVAADREENIARACAFLREAAARDTDVAVLPEMFCCPYQNHCFRPYGEAANGPARAALSRSSRRAGSITPAMSTTARAVRSPSTARSISLISTLPAGSASGSRTPSPPAIRLPPLRRSLASWGFVSALTCALRNSPAACACGVPGSFSSRRPST